VEENKTCGKILTVLSWVVVVLTMPFSLLVCFKVSLISFFTGNALKKVCVILVANVKFWQLITRLLWQLESWFKRQNVSQSFRSKHRKFHSGQVRFHQSVQKMKVNFDFCVNLHKVPGLRSV